MDDPGYAYCSSDLFAMTKRFTTTVMMRLLIQNRKRKRRAQPAVTEKSTTVRNYRQAERELANRQIEEQRSGNEQKTNNDNNDDNNGLGGKASEVSNFETLQTTGYAQDTLEHSVVTAHL